MLPTVRKIRLIVVVITLCSGASASAWASQPVQVKTLDDNNKEVLRPIPKVLVKPEAVKGEEKAVAKSLTDTKNKTEPKTKTDPKTDIKTESKPATKAKAEAPKPKKRVASSGPHFVPPPPPVTPTMMGDASDFAFFSGMPLEMLSKDALKDRAKEISIQYKDACRELEDHTVAKQEKIQRAKDFVGLYQEGVVSRRELEASQKEANEVNSDIDRLTFKAKELKGVLDRINKRLAPPVAKKPARKLIN